MDLDALRNKKARFAIGLMSGTSGDGIDAAIVRLKGTGPSLAVKYIDQFHLPYDNAFRTRILSEHLSVKDVCTLNFEVGERFAEAAQGALAIAKEKEITIDFIASHGQTMAHYPPPNHERYGTLQIGESAVIAERTGLLVVSDFRQRDMAAGGQGAPLVPYADWLMWRHKKEPKTVACLNLGGIANFTVVTPEFDDVIAFDTGPANMLIDGAVRLLTRGERNFDRDGAMAKEGIVVDEFMDYLLDHSFFDRKPPKSTGKEEFGAEVYLRDALASRKEHSPEDLVATVTTATAKSIVEAYNRFLKPKYKIEHMVVGGGGVKNKALMSMIIKSLRDVQVYTMEQYGIPCNAREAMAFAILGNETLMNTAANVPQATGAEGPRVLGKITPA